MNTVVVYGSDGNDAWRIRKSIASLRRVGVTADIAILTVGSKGIDDRYIRAQCKVIVPVDSVFAELGFEPAKYNGPWPFATVSRLAVPLVPELQAYDRALVLDTDVLALTTRFCQWLTWPTRGFEVIGAAGDTHLVDCGLNTDIREVDRCFSSPERAVDMQRRLWCRNPPYSHSHISIGISVWDLSMIRSDLEWYKTRLRWFWEYRVMGFMSYGAESFVNVMMDFAGLVDQSMHEKEDSVGFGSLDPAAHHFNKVAGTDDPNNKFNTVAREMRLDDLIARVDPAGSPPVPDARPPEVLVPPSCGKTAVVHITDGNPDDCRRMVWSMRSLARHSSLAYDSIVLCPDAAAVPDLASDVPEAVRHGKVFSVRDMCGVLEASSGIHPRGWNRPWPFVVLYRLGIPLHPAFAGYDRVLYLDTDTLVFSDSVDEFITADIDGYELGACIDTVLDGDRTRDDLWRELRLDFSERIRARYGKVLAHCPYINAGVLLWNLPEIRKDIGWYKERLSMFWEAECRGRLHYLDQDFINGMTMLRTGFSMVYNFFCLNGREASACVIRHYAGHQYDRMASDAKAAGVDRQLGQGVLYV